MQELSFRNDILPLKDKLFRLALRITFDRAEAEDVAVRISLSIMEKLEEVADGFYFMTPFNRVSLITRIIHARKPQ